ncbi:SOS response-associated peptidase [Actinomadura rayongensis]
MPIKCLIKHAAPAALDGAGRGMSEGAGKMASMCGRYATARARQELLDQFAVGLDDIDGDLEPDYNVAPTKQVPAVLTRAPRDEPTEAVRELRTLRWGLVPSWAKDLAIGSRMINARFETVHEKPAYRRAFARRRCLLPADGYYEWYKTEGEGKPRKQPFFIRPQDGSIMAMAGLYELWKSPADEWVWTCTVITTDAPDALGRIHDRMPMIVRRDRWDAWLDPALSDADEVRGLLVPALDGSLATAMEAFPVGQAVSNVRNNGPQLIEPLADDTTGPAGPGEGALF